MKDYTYSNGTEWKAKINEFSCEIQDEFNTYCKELMIKGYSKVTVSLMKYQRFTEIIDIKYKESFMLFDTSKHLTTRYYLYKDFVMDALSVLINNKDVIGIIWERL